MKSKNTAAILAVFLGGIGIHKFYLNKPIAGIIYLIFSWTFIPMITGFIEGLVFSAMSNEKFNNKYNSFSQPISVTFTTNYESRPQRKPPRKKPKRINENGIISKNPHAEPYCMVFDCETTGLIKDNSLRATKANVENFPRVVELAWGIFSRTGELIKERNRLIKQEQAIPKDVIKVHGITDEMCEKNGDDIKDVLQVLLKDMEGVDRIVGHNVTFDKRIVESEYIRAGITKPFIKRTSYDTMSIAKKYFHTGKWYKLQDLHYDLFGKEVDNSRNHRAAYDAYITAKCFFAMRNSGEIPYFKN